MPKRRLARRFLSGDSHEELAVLAAVTVVVGRMAGTAGTAGTAVLLATLLSKAHRNTQMQFL